MNSPRRFTPLLHRFGLHRWLGRARRATIVPELPLAPDAPDAERARVTRDFLANVQGGILSAGARGDHVALWLFAFSDPKAYARNAAAVNAAAELVTTALAQYPRVRLAGGGFRSLALTGDGLLACGIDGEVRDGTGGFPPDVPRWLLGGMRQFGEAVGWMHDPVDANGTPCWEPQFLQRIDGAWLLGAESPGALEALLEKTKAWGDDRGLAGVAVERGQVRRDAASPQQVREPFGFVDGLSTQNFFRDDPFALKTPLEKVFLTTPRHFGCSFLVVRKLQQNVKAFRQYRLEVGVAKASEIIGRLPDGTPLAERTAVGAPNDFDFSNDPKGARCPLTAHIRRANPRAVNDGVVDSAERHLVRRGVVFGTDEALASPEGAEHGVGLLFMAYMSDLDTFRVIQGSWFSHQNFPVPQPPPPVAADALIFGGPTGISLDRWVTPMGGAYLFVPSLTWMRELRPEIP